jgi:hypothetical protein
MMQGDRTGKRRTWIALSAALLGSMCANVGTGCGTPASPLPPTLNLPAPVHDLAAQRAGDTVHLTFSVPQKTTDKLPVRGPMTAKLCRSVDTGPCQPAGTLAIPAQKTFAMDDNLPAALTQGPARLLTYKLSILNRAGKCGQASDAAYAIAGVAPAPVAGFTAMPKRKGIVLSWQGVNLPDAFIGWVRFDRTRTAGPASQPATRENSGNNPLTGHKVAAEPAEQVFRVAETAQELHPSAVDITAHTGDTYRYVAQRIQEITLAGQTVEMASLPSAPAETAYRDVFPPPVPIGLVSAADTASKAIDLDWTPDVDPGLAGYIVYRRAAGTGQTPERISPAGKPVITSEWNDTTALPGQRYAYSVSAIDVSGNESQRSTEIEDEWNTPGSQPASPASPQPNP